MICVVFLLCVMHLNTPWMECSAQAGSTTKGTTTVTPDNTTTKSSDDNATTTSSDGPTKTSPDGPTTTFKPSPEPPLSPFPFIVSIAVNELKTKGTKEYVHLVGAVIINSTSVMSSCHTLKQNKYKKNLTEYSMIIVAGTVRIGWGMSKNTQMRQVDRIYLHQKCMGGETTTDRIDIKFNVALVTLKNPLVLNQYVEPMRLISYHKHTLMKYLTSFTEKRIPCNKTTFLWANNSDGISHNPTEYRDSLTNNIAKTQHWSLSVRLATYPYRLISSIECRQSFCILSDVGCKHDYSMHRQICAYPRKIYRKSRYGPNSAKGLPIVCSGFIFGVWNFVIEEFSCSPDVYSHPDCILGLLDDYKVDVPDF